MKTQAIKILFVEDDDVDQLAFKREVTRQKLDYFIQYANSFEEAKSFLKSQSYDIVITDYNLGDGNALNVLEYVKKIPLIVITGAGDEEIAISTMKAGAYDYIVKDQERLYLQRLPDIIDNAIKHNKESQQFELLSNVLMNINDMVTITDMDSNLVFVNDAFVNNYGYKRSELIGKKIDLVRADNYTDEFFNELVERTLNSGGWKGELINDKKDGTKFPIFLSTSVIVDQDGKPTHLFGVSNDITESKKAKEALSREKERLSVTLRNIGAGVITTNEKGDINSMNKAAEEITGCLQEDGIGKSICQLFGGPGKKNNCENVVEKVLSYGKPVRSSEPREVIFGSNHSKIIIENAAPIKDNDNNLLGVVLAFEDITDKVKMEEELQKSRKLESLGVLAGGIAHDFNNILTSIIGNISLALMYVQPTDTIYPNLEGALKACERSRDLTHQLLTFAKGGAPIKENASIVNLVKDTSEFVTRGSNCKCRFNFGENIWTVEIDIGQISQVINNLIINATQAMPAGGSIHIDIENVTDKEEIHQNRLLKDEQQYVKIKIRDEGIGIPEKIINQIFDPYFSTKKKGSGLGLASAYSIIKQHEGYIDVQSEVNEGTTFTIYLPAIPEKELGHNDDDSIIVKGSAKILVMDDEASIRDVVGKMLKILGYDPVFTENGDDTIEEYNKTFNGPGAVDLLILDMTIPGGKGGEETIRELLKINPNIKAIVASGYSEDPVMANYKDFGFTGRLLKPFDIKTLSKALSTVLK